MQPTCSSNGPAARDFFMIHRTKMTHRWTDIIVYELCMFKASQFSLFEPCAVLKAMEESSALSGTESRGPHRKSSECDVTNRMVKSSSYCVHFSTLFSLDSASWNSMTTYFAMQQRRHGQRISTLHERWLVLVSESIATLAVCSYTS